MNPLEPRDPSQSQSPSSDPVDAAETGMLHVGTNASDSVSVFLSAPKLVVKNPTGAADEVFTLKNGQTYSVGRLSSADIRLNEEVSGQTQYKVSRQQAELTVSDAGAIAITHLAAKSKTFVNGRELDKDVPTPIRPGDAVSFGSTDYFVATLLAAQQVKEVNSDKRSFSHQETGADSMRFAAVGGSSTDAALQMQMNLTATQRQLESVNVLLASLQLAQNREQMFERLSQALTEIFPSADRATIFTADVRGVWSASAVALSDGANPDREVFISRTIVEEIEQSCNAILSNRVLEDMADSASLKQQQICSIMCCPFYHDGELVGLLQLDAEAGVNFTQEDLKLLAQAAHIAELSNSAAEVRAQAEHSKRVIDSVGEVQSAGLPDPEQTFEGVTVAFTHNPLEGGAGDFYDIVPVDERRSGFLLFDVSGHDSASALWGAMMNGRLNTILQDFNADTAIETDLPRAIARASDQQAKAFKGESKFASGIAAVFDPEDKTLEMVRAGHDHMLVFNPEENQTVLLSEEGPSVADGGRLLRATQEGFNGPLCVVDSETVDPMPLFSTEKFQLKSGDIAFGFTDGFFELQNVSGEQFGKERLQAAFESAARQGLSPAEVVRSVHQALLDFVGAEPLTDDVSGFALKVE